MRNPPTTGAPGLGSASEERSIELTRLRGRETWLREYVDHFLGQVPLPRRKRRRVALVPAQPRTNVRVEPHLLAHELVGKSVQVSHLFEQGLELLVVDRHVGWHPSFLDESLRYRGSQQTSQRPSLRTQSSRGKGKTPCRLGPYHLLSRANRPFLMQKRKFLRFDASSKWEGLHEDTEVNVKVRSLLVGLAVVAVTTSAAVAAPPAGKGKPTTGEGCKPKVTVVLKGTLTAAPLSVDVTRANRWGRAYVEGAASTSVAVDADTKVRRKGKALIGELVVGDRVLVQARVCKADLAEGAMPALTAVRVVAHPAKA